MPRPHDDFIGEHPLRPESLMMSYGFDPFLSEGAVKPPIFQTSTFAFRNAEAGKRFFQVAYGLEAAEPGEEQGLIYSRLNNPNLEILEDRLTLWDGAEACALFDSGMAAITTSLLELCAPDDVVLYSGPLYGGTDHFIRHVLPKFRITGLGFRAGTPAEEIEHLVRESGVAPRIAVIYVETPANPTNALVDIAHCAALARQLSTPERPVYVLVDNTFLGPLWQHPLKHGADLVLYSATKFLGGHSDVVAGAVLGRRELLQRIRAMRTFLGTMGSPWTAWLLLRSLETLKLRMTSQMKNARYVADFLADHPMVERVYYLGHLTEDHPQFALYRRQCLAPGSMISFDVKGGEAAAFRVLNALELIKLAVSLGGTESLAEHPFSMTHADVPPAEKAAMGLTDKMIRLSIGVEHPEDLIADLRQALGKAAGT
jgi:methionine-gamma-lyase